MKSFLMHFGIKGQQWGVRRYQNEDGTLTEEGRQRYLTLNRNTEYLYNQVVNSANKDLARINKKYDKVDLNDDRNNLEYSREVRDMWQEHYRNILAKDIGTDPSSIKGQKWLDDVIGYKNMDSEVEELERKVNGEGKSSSKRGSDVSEKKVKEKKEKSSSRGSDSVEAPSLSNSKAGRSVKVTDYSNKKMDAIQAYNQAYSDLEKQIPNFYSLPQAQQDELFIGYMNDSGLYKWT